MTWLKKKLHNLGLHRKGPLVQYSPVSQVQAAIEVWYVVCWYTVEMLTVLRDEPDVVSYDNYYMLY